jgi:hypothetical protein
MVTYVVARFAGTAACITLHPSEAAGGVDVQEVWLCRLSNVHGHVEVATNLKAQKNSATDQDQTVSFLVNRLDCCNGSKKDGFKAPVRPLHQHDKVLESDRMLVLELTFRGCIYAPNGVDVAPEWNHHAGGGEG